MTISQEEQCCVKCELSGRLCLRDNGIGNPTHAIVGKSCRNPSCDCHPKEPAACSVTDQRLCGDITCPVHFSAIGSVSPHKSSPQEPAASQEEWEKEFIETFYVYNLKNSTPAGAEKQAVAFIRDQREKVRAEERERAEQEIRRYREHLRFIWRWIDRLHGGKSHDNPEKNWRDYVGVLTNYPNAPHQTGDWFEDEPLTSTTNDTTK